MHLHHWSMRLATQKRKVGTSCVSSHFSAGGGGGKMVFGVARLFRILPGERVHGTLPWPEIRTFHQAFGQWIVTNVGCFLGPFFGRTNAMVEQAPLPTPLRAPEASREPVLPKLCPAFDTHRRSARRRCKKVKVIRHEQILTHSPRCCLVQPDVVQQGHDFIRCAPCPTTRRAYGTKDKGRAIERNVNAFGRCLPSYGSVTMVAHRDEQCGGNI